MADHTEGPWYVDAGDDVYKDGRMICAWPKNSDRTVAENRANRALIAAAPDLLKALKIVTGKGLFHITPEELSFIENAENKAEGKAGA